VAVFKVGESRSPCPTPPLFSPSHPMPLGKFLGGIHYQQPESLRALVAFGESCKALPLGGNQRGFVASSTDQPELRLEARRLTRRLCFRLLPNHTGLFFRLVASSRLRASGWTLPTTPSRQNASAAPASQRRTRRGARGKRTGRTLSQPDSEQDTAKWRAGAARARTERGQIPPPPL
jgi:hypothetical protein